MLKPTLTFLLLSILCGNAQDININLLTALDASVKCHVCRRHRLVEGVLTVEVVATG